LKCPAIGLPRDPIVYGYPARVGVRLGSVRAVPSLNGPACRSISRTAFPPYPRATARPAQAFADLLLNGLNQDRVRRLFDHAIAQSHRLQHLPRNWATGISRDTGLFQVEHWKCAFADAESRHASGVDVTAAVMSTLELLARGIEATAQAGEELLSAGARVLWHRALKNAPADALGLSLQTLRLDGYIRGGGVNRLVSGRTSLSAHLVPTCGSWDSFRVT